ncbi:NUDIX domain-containing protein [Clostridium sp. WILCCON 0269]|uniref:NUDIX domain-containing protein n=1 Tax=Candidatus Clostridium eludens TaxID=3381663 RepID=A0ABW8SRW5_9CLOT
MKRISKELLYEGKWVRLEEVTYSGKNNEILKWESIERTNTTSTVIIISKLVPSNRYIFIKQYRPAIDKYVIGFPAGLVENEDLFESALRELKEETGYRGKVKSVGPELYSNPALVTDRVRVVKIEIDENLEENKNPQQQLEEAEDIQVFALHKEEIREFLLREQSKGTAVAIAPWYVFYGLYES